MKAMKERVRINAKSAIAAEYWEKGKCDTCPVYDMHAHMGEWRSIYFPRGETEQMVESMERAGVRLLCFAHHAALFAPDIGNKAAVEAVRKFPDKLRAYMSVNPHYPDAVRKDIASYDGLKDVYAGMKILADYHQVKLSDERYKAALEFANERALPVLIHTWGGSEYDGAEQVRIVAGKYPKAKLLMGHSLHNHWLEAAGIAVEFANVYLELTAVIGKRGVVELMAEKAGTKKMLYGTDLPWFDERNYIGAILSADITDDDRHNIFHRNAEKLLNMR